MHLCVVAQLVLLGASFNEVLMPCAVGAENTMKKRLRQIATLLLDFQLETDV